MWIGDWRLGVSSTSNPIPQSPIQGASPMSRAQLVEELQRVVGPRALVQSPAALLTYEADGCVMDLHAPTLVVLPETTEQVAQVVRLAQRAGMPIVPRGAGTGLAGGATPMSGGVVISTTRMDKVIEVDARNRRA